MNDDFRNEQMRHRQQLDRQARDIDDALQGDVVIDGGRALKLRSANGTYWGLVVSNTGTLSTVNLGTTL